MSLNPTVNEEFLRDLMHQITDKALSFNDIIPRKEVPYLKTSELRTYSERYGSQIVNLYLSMRDYSDEIDRTIKYLLKNMLSFNIVPSFVFSLILMTRYKMGIADTPELIIMMNYELLKHQLIDQSAVILTNNIHSSIHTILLLNEPDIKVGNNFIHQFASYPPTSIIIDPILNYVGPANQYYEINHDFLNKFQFTKVLEVTPSDPTDLSTFIDIDAHSQELVQSLIESNIRPFMSKALLPLLKTGFACSDAVILENSQELSNLQASYPEMNFSGLKHKNGSIDAFCLTNDRVSVSTALNISRHLGKGSFYNNSNQQRFFVIPQINPVEPRTSCRTLAK